LRLIVVDAGPGVSVSSHVGGRIVDATHPEEEGPFGMDHAGGLPALRTAELAGEGGLSRAAFRWRLAGEGGVASYLGTRDPAELAARCARGDDLARAVFRALVLAVAKAVGGMAAAMRGRVDAVVATGTLAAVPMFADGLRQHVAFIAPMSIIPGGGPLEALADGVFRVLARDEELRTYE
jgi:butyrate kinase